MMKHDISRRRFLGAAALAGAALPGTLNRALAAEAPAPPQLRPTIPVIDTHIHLFDPFRPGGVPWPSATNPAHAVMYKTSLPSRYRPIAEPLGIVGAIEIECSPLLEDNQWVLDVAEKDDIMVGTIGHLTPGTPDFQGKSRPFPQEPALPRHSLRIGGAGRPTNSTGRSLSPTSNTWPTPTWSWTRPIPAWRCWPMSCA